MRSAAAADARIFAGGHWRFGDDNKALHIHHLGGGNFVSAGASIRAAQP